ncbi:MAG: APC family permease, partial [Sulfuricaulis sp.]|nr:APC family permease [Sulfuricaulis sp.]
TQSKWVQNILTLVLALSILGVVVAGLSATPAVAVVPAAAGQSTPLFSGLALIFILLTYGGWNEAAYLTAEMRDTRRGIVRALIIGILIITTLYLLLNLAYVNALGLAGMRTSKAVATDLMRVTWGDAGALVLGAAVVTAALSTLNATIFTGARTNYALGRDFALFGFLGKWHERGSPVNALLLQGAIALLLVLLASFTSDGFQTMVAYTAPAFWLFFLLTGVSLFVLRRQQPVNADPFRVPLYPITPVLFCAMCVYMLYSSIGYAMSLDPGSIGALVGIGVLCAGIPVMLVARGAQRQSQGTSD